MAETRKVAGVGNDSAQAGLRAGAFALAAGIILWGCLGNWSYWIDDSYISARYARNFASGLGPVFNEGERVEGYTNFLWVVMLGTIQKAAGIRTDITNGIKALGVAFYLMAAAFIAFGARPLRAADKNKKPAETFALSMSELLMWLFFVAAYTPFAFYAVGGMETIALVSVVTGAVCLWVRRGEPNVWSLTLFGVAALVRFDAALLFGLGLALSLAQWRLERRSLGSFVKMAAPIVIVYAAYQIWRVWYYGDIFPNSYYAKIAGRAAGDYGWKPKVYFWHVNLMWVFLPLLAAQFVADVRRRNHAMWMLFVIVAVFEGYLLSLPVDWMKMGRMEMPIVPVAFLLIARALAWAGTELGRRMGRGAGLAVMALMAGAVAVCFFEPIARPEIRSVYRIVRSNGEPIIERFRRLSRMFAAIARPTDLVYSDVAGTLGYLGEMKILDSWGLNDRTIGKEGVYKIEAGGGVAYWGRIHPTYVAGRRPDFLMIETLGADGRREWGEIPAAVHAAKELAQVPGFFEEYRVGYVTDGKRPEMYCYFLQRADEEERQISKSAGEGFEIGYEPLPAKVAREFAERAREKTE